MFPSENATGLWFENTWVPLKKVLGSSKNHVKWTYKDEQLRSRTIAWGIRLGSIGWSNKFVCEGLKNGRRLLGASMRPAYGSEAMYW